jgi:hypothetical protein
MEVWSPWLQRVLGRALAFLAFFLAHAQPPPRCRVTITMGHQTDIRPRACIAARLAALDRPADFLTEDAVEALLAHAGGSLPRLRAALASTLFLGSTEDAPRVDRSYVERAVSALPPMTARRTGIHSVWLLAGVAIVALAVGLPLTLWRADPGTVAQNAAPMATAGLAQKAARPAENAAQKTGAPVARPPPVMVLPPLSPSVGVGNPPLPPPGQPLGASPAVAGTSPPPRTMSAASAAGANLPALRPGRTVTTPPARAMTAPPAIVLRYQPADRWAADKLAAASAYLRRAGFTRIYAVPLRGHATPIGVRYFFPDDQDAARRVLGVATGPLGERPLMQRRTAMLLVRQPAGQHAHPPGTLELILP